MIFMSVDLPAPFSPNNAVTLPRWIVKSTPFSAWVAPYVLVIPRARMTTLDSAASASGSVVTVSVEEVTIRLRS